ncbi:hypothetical protein [Kaistia sp. MMO-174]|uniref:hypothetical protein n=1 Tax=Kaistia sp. MMO-174 TaxID=3081256 RepID=UPI0030186027
MTDTMIERVAIALYGADESDLMDNWHSATSSLQNVYRRKARAAVEAMREPSNDVLEAMWAAMFVGRFTGSELPMLGAGFEAAIDAALQETKG